MNDPALGSALVTGASSGIGAVYADRLAGRGHDLILVARNMPRLRELADRLRAKGVAVEVIGANLAREADLARIEARLASDGAITTFVNNAGINLGGTPLDNSTEELKQLIAVNVTAPTRLATAAARAFVSRGLGTIINIASVLALAPELLNGAYSASKAYLLNLTLALDAQLTGRGVRVQAVLPGATRTEIWARSGHDLESFPPGMVMDPGHLVDAALLGLDRGELVTIPPLADEAHWTTYEAARRALGPHLSNAVVAERYQAGATGT